MQPVKQETLKKWENTAYWLIYIGLIGCIIGLAISYKMS
jgi:hypothetical protein